MEFSDNTAPVQLKDLSKTAQQMAISATAFLDSITPTQRDKCCYKVDCDERYNWDYRPVLRQGLPFTEMNSAQQLRALALLASGLSREGNITALNIMSLEQVLGKLEGSGSNHSRDPDLYFLTLFGRPRANKPWGWRIEGHHLSVNFLIAGNTISCCPQFFGANPARVPTEPLKGFATLPREEETARKLLHMLDKEQTQRAIQSDQAPLDIVTDTAARIRMDDPVGLAVSDMHKEQQQVFFELLGVYLNRMTPQLADAEMEQLYREGFGTIHFAWAGSRKSGQGHYYRLHGADLVVEYDNVQNNANHIHSVWRNLRRDWGDDLLRNHYAQSHSSNGVHRPLS